MIREVRASSEALEELARRGVRAVKLKLVEETSEWTMCCVGSACATYQRVVVEEGAGEGGGFDRFEVGGVEVYVSKEVGSRAEGVVELAVERGELVVRGVEVRSTYEVKPAFAPRLPEWA